VAKLAFFLQAVTIVEGGFLDSVGSAVKGAADGVADGAAVAGQAISDGASQAGSAVVDGVGKAGEAVQGAAAEALRITADAALQESGKCGEIWEKSPKAEPVLGNILVSAWQKSETDPSADSDVCFSVGYDAVVDEMHRVFTDATGIVDKIAGGLFADFKEHICGEATMATLKAEEPIRKSKPTEYKKHVRKTLREWVFTPAWVEGVLESHCGSRPAVTRLFAEQPNHALGRFLQAAPTIATVWFSTTSFIVATGILIAACRRRRQPDDNEESMLLDTRGALAALGDDDAIE